MLTARRGTSFHVAGYRAPHEAGKFPSDNYFCDIGPFVVSENHTIVFPPQTFIRFIGIGVEFRSVAILSGLESFRIEADLSLAVTLGCLYQQVADITVSSHGDA